MNNILSRSSIFLGRCVTSDVPSASRICVHTFELDERLLMYFENRTFIYADDPKKQCQPGDYVLVKAAAHKNKLITHTVDQLIYKLGYDVDPLTGKRCVRHEYLEDMMRTSALFGKKLPYLEPEIDTKEEKP